MYLLALQVVSKALSAVSKFVDYFTLTMILEHLEKDVCQWLKRLAFQPWQSFLCVLEGRPETGGEDEQELVE